jgi:hypothetical protein
MPETGPPVNYINALRTALSDLSTLRPPRLRIPWHLPTIGPADENADFPQQVRAEHVARLRVIIGSFLGVTMLFVAQWLQPHGGAPFTGPHDGAAWLAAVCGIIGIWLVPGVWLSALIMRTGTGPVARLATRIGVLLGWYALVGIVVHYSAQAARPTAGGIIGVTTAATAAACLGVALGFLRHPLDHRRRILVSAAAGSLCAQAVIWLDMHYWTYQINYEHIRRLDWLIVLACALLTALGQANPPTLPIRDPAQIQRTLAALTAMTVTTAITVAAAVTWPTTQQLPAELAAEQVAAPAGADMALTLTGIGPPDFAVLRDASFTTADDLGHPLPAHFQIVNQRTVSDVATLLVVLDPTTRRTLCAPTARLATTVPIKVTVRDQSSGMSTQAVLPTRWCAR